MKYKVGDKVRVRSWEDMEREFGLDEFGDINTEIWFAPPMKEYCGKVVEISEIVGNYYKIRKDKELWSFTDEMLEPVIFDWETFKDGTKKIAVHCKTKEEAKDFCKQMHEHGMTWLDGESYLEDNYWENYRENICYTNNGHYSRIGFCKKENYTILEWSDYMNTEKKKFTKADIKDGMVIESRDGILCVKIKELLLQRGWCKSFSKYSNNLYFEEDRECDIIAVYEADMGKVYCLEDMLKKENLIPIWKREKETIITEAERFILENRNHLYKWIARDKDGEIKLFEKKPFKIEDAIEDAWVCKNISPSHSSYCSLECFMHLFPFIKWEDEEPYNIDELLKNCIKKN